MPTPPAFAQAFPIYLVDARTARTENRHHDYRRGLFLDLLRQAFGIRADEVDVEHVRKIRLTHNRPNAIICPGARISTSSPEDDGDAIRPPNR
jgi:hypothetical protein